MNVVAEKPVRISSTTYTSTDSTSESDLVFFPNKISNTSTEHSCNGQTFRKSSVRNCSDTGVVSGENMAEMHYGNDKTQVKGASCNANPQHDNTSQKQQVNSDFLESRPYIINNNNTNNNTFASSQQPQININFYISSDLIKVSGDDQNNSLFRNVGSAALPNNGQVIISNDMRSTENKAQNNRGLSSNKVENLNAGNVSESLSIRIKNLEGNELFHDLNKKSSDELAVEKSVLLSTPVPKAFSLNGNGLSVLVGPVKVEIELLTKNNDLVFDNAITSFVPKEAPKDFDTLPQFKSGSLSDLKNTTKGGGVESTFNNRLRIPRTSGFNSKKIPLSPQSVSRRFVVDKKRILDPINNEKDRIHILETIRFLRSTGVSLPSGALLFSHQGKGNTSGNDDMSQDTLINSERNEKTIDRVRSEEDLSLKHTGVMVDEKTLTKKSAGVVFDNIWLKNDPSKDGILTSDDDVISIVNEYEISDEESSISEVNKIASDSKAIINEVTKRKSYTLMSYIRDKALAVIKMPVFISGDKL